MSGKSVEHAAESKQVSPELFSDAEFPLRPRRRALRRTAWSAVLLLIVGAFGLVAWRRGHAAPVMHYESAPADRGTIAAKVTATGSLSALLTVQVGAQVSGRVQELFVDYNSPVTKGEIVAKLDPLLFQAAVEQAKASLASFEGALKKDQAQEVYTQVTYTRTKTLKDEQIMAQADLDTALANSEAAKAQVEADESNIDSAKAALNQAEVNLGYTVIVSPIDGTVISRNVDVGQTVAASLSAPTLFVIAQDLRRMQVDTNVGEADVGRLKAGMPASFTVDAYPGRPFVGKLRQVRNAAQTVQNVVTYDAVIDVANPNLLLKPGMTANVSFVAAQKDNVIRLRNAALRFQPDPQLLKRIGMDDPPDNGPVPQLNRKTVWVLRDGKPVPVLVTTGVSDGTWSELLEGDVKPGDILITDMSMNPGSRFF